MDPYHKLGLIKLADFGVERGRGRLASATVPLDVSSGVPCPVSRPARPDRAPRRRKSTSPRPAQQLALVLGLFLTAVAAGAAFRIAAGPVEFPDASTRAGLPVADLTLESSSVEVTPPGLKPMPKEDLAAQPPTSPKTPAVATTTAPPRRPGARGRVRRRRASPRPAPASAAPPAQTTLQPDLEPPRPDEVLDPFTLRSETSP